MATWSELIEDQIFMEAADLGKLERNAIKSILEPALREARSEMMKVLLENWDSLTWNNRERLRAFIQTFTGLLDQKGIKPIEEGMTPLLNDLVEGTYAQAATEINTVLKLPLLATTAPPAFYAKVIDRTLIEGQPLFSYLKKDGSPGWWDSLSASSRDRIARDIRKSLLMGESTDQATRRLLGKARGDVDHGSLGMTKRQAEAVARTSIHAVTNATRGQFYEDNNDIVEGISSLATLDSRTTIQCRSYDGLKWRLPDYKPIGGHGKVHLPPPRHWRCRSVMTPILAELDEIDRKAKEMGLELEPAIRAARDGPRERRSASGNMDGWLRTQGEEKQNAMLGKGRAELWREGKVTLQDLINAQGETLPLEQLRRIASRRSALN